MQTVSNERGFTLIELLLSTTITLVVVGTAMTAFKNGLMLNEAATLIADSNQNLRAGTNLLVRDLLQAGRGIPVGGIPVPSGVGTSALNRPSPPGMLYEFDNTIAAVLPAITSGSSLGPVVTGHATDIITLLSTDQLSFVTYTTGAAAGILEVNWTASSPQTPWPAGLIAPTPTLAADGASLNVGQFATWISDPVNGIKKGDVLLFTNQLGSAIQTVTSTSSSQVFFASNSDDTFNFNQRAAPQGSIMSIRNGAVFPQTTVVRLQILTYYVDNPAAPGVPRLVRQYNHFQAEALAGIVEDLDISYDLVDGVTNPTKIENLPYTDANDVTYTENLIRKVNLHVGVRSETKSSSRGDYIRHHLSTVVSIRSLAYIDRYK